MKEIFSSDLRKYVYCIQVSEEDSIYDWVYVYDTDTKQNQMLWEWSEYPIAANQIGFRDFRIASESDVIAFVGYYFPSADIGAHSTSCYGVYDKRSDEMMFTIHDVDILLDQKNGIFLFYHNDGIEDSGNEYLMQIHLSEEQWKNMNNIYAIAVPTGGRTDIYPIKTDTMVIRHEE